MPEVLICDDDEAIRTLLERVLLRAGLAVDLASDGEEAVRKIERRDYSLLVLDWMMPRMSGWDVVARLKNTPRRPPVLVLTANQVMRFEDLDESVVLAVMRKPFELDMLVTIVRAIAMRTTNVALLRDVTRDTIRPR